MSFRENAQDALRLASWRAPKSVDPHLSRLSMVGIFAAVILAVAGAELLLAKDFASAFSPYGINAVIASVALHCVVVVAFANVDRTPATLRNLMLVYIVAIFVGISIDVGGTFLAPHKLGDPYTRTSSVVTLAIFATWLIWMTGAARQAFRRAPLARRPMLRAFAFTACYLLSALALPYWPIFAPKDFNATQANIWEIVRRADRAQASKSESDEADAQRETDRQAARLEGRQTAQLDAAVAALEPRDASTSNVFAIGVAGWSEQDVFMRETQQSLDVLTAHFNLGKRVLSLVNNASTTDARPVASMQNLGAALRAVGARMDSDRDVLILTMTSHGSPDGFALRLDNLIWRTLDPATLKILLDDAGIKNRILIVSSCYSGAFATALADENTMILTAASATRTSFGCANERKWTYFGEAFFERGLKDNATLAGAFQSARRTIGQWEREQKLTPSDPQIFVGAEIARRFPQLVGDGSSLAARETEGEPARSE